MSRADFILDLVVKAAPYRDIFSGVKPEEYRVGSVHNMKRLLTGSYQDCSTGFFPFHTARISLGYASDRPSHLRKIRGIRWGAPNPAWCYGIVTAEKCFIIELGEML